MISPSDEEVRGIKSSNEAISEIEADRWVFQKAEGSHHHFKHPNKPGKVTVPHPKKNLHPKTYKKILKQAGLI
ncbi:MAG: type II toxin-antitoxin system HicA family toxin [Synergistaceae bacterium]|jgi:predicted RNA binding protein YcfA (HicA-like mRNA interferase family)|nr:type II toxin-antitoxin system HicA family toxin [Synergistaceae bacterium]